MKIPWRRCLALAAFIYTASAGAALAQTATVVGRITDAATGASLGTPVSPPRDPASAVLRDSSGFWIGSASADATGTYAFNGLTPGTYYLHTLNIRGYADKTSDGINCIGVCEPTRPIVLSAGTALTVNFALDASAVITGTIRDRATRAPMTGARVSIYDVRQRVVASAVADSTGTYRAGSTGIGLAGSTYYAVAQADPGYIGQMYSDVRCALSCRLTDASPIRVATAQTAGGIDFLLDRKGAITGRVGDATTSAPIPGVTVFAQDLARTVNGNATTGADGRFTIDNLPPGTWTVFAPQVPAGYVPQAFDVVAIPHCAAVWVLFPAGSLRDACAADLRLAAPVAVTAGATIGGVDLKLRRAGSIAGRLTRAGQPLSGTISVYDGAGVDVETVFVGSGDYVADGLPAGTYFVRGGVGTPYDGRLYAATPCEAFNSCLPTTGTPVVVSDGARTNGIDIDLPAFGTIAGTVRSASGALLEATLSVYAGDRRVGGTSAKNGAYSMSGLPPGAYQLRASVPGFIDEWYGNVCAPCGDRGVPVVVPAGGSATGIDFQLDPAGKIAGLITLDSSVRGSTGVFVEAIRGDGAVLASTAPGLNGQYTLDGLPAGSYYVRGGSRVQDPVRATRTFGPTGGEFSWKLYKDAECDGADCPLTSATAVAVTAGATTSGIDMTLNAGGVIEGQVVTEGGGLLPSPNGGLAGPSVLQFPAVEAFTADGRRVGNLPDRLVYGKGHYNITGLRPGRYFLRASGAGYASVIYRDLICPACSPSQGTPVTLNGPDTRSGIDFTLLPGGSITGTVRDDAGAVPIAGVTVSAFTESGSVAATGLTNAAGSYLLEGLGAGRYFLATSNAIGYADEVYDNVACGSCDPLRGRLVEVQGGATTASIDFGLSRGALIVGKVTDAGGASGGAATVSIFNDAGTLVARTKANDLGIYAVPVPAGTNFARLEPHTNLAAILYDGKLCPGGACDPTAGTPISSVAGQTIRGIDFRAPVCAAVAITPPSLPAASVGTAYSATLRTSPGGPFTYTRQSGTLPPGLSLAGDGTINGTPAARGRYGFSVGAADAAGCGGSRAFTIDVTGCTPVLPVSNRASQTFDVPGSASVVQVYLDSACSTPVAFNAPWLRKNREFGPTVLEIAVSANPGGRRTGTVTVAGYTVTINQGAVTSSVPFGSFDSPPDGNVAAGSVAVTGWVLDDLRVVAVHLYRSPGAGESSGDKFIGDATLVPGARPDVERAYPEFPYANRAGWGYLLLTNMLPNQGNGTFTVTAVAEDVEGNRIGLGSRTIVANNAATTKPFGAIDTPSQGETIGGPSYLNFGWVLTPKPKTIPTNGSTITVLVDGAPVGTVAYNNPRPDIAALFPGLNNTNGPVGYRVINTTTLLDGLHTIAWVVTDDAGAVEGVGSRYFTVANGTSQSLARVVTPPSLTAAPARAAARQVFARELEPIEIDLSDAEPASCRAVFSGIERVGAAERALPIGSSLDRERGVFRWQPGPGFAGTYELSFDVGRCDGSVTRIDVSVTIAPR
jgi:carboxypeptidase family protein/putative Ig domain-containing protein